MQAPHSPFDMPSQINYFIDPYRVMKKYESCPLNAKKSKLNSYELGVVWKYIHGTNLNGAHNSLIDVKAQTDIILHKSFVPFINRSSSMQKITDIFTATQQNQWKRDMEPIRPVHAPWREQTRGDSVTWSPGRADQYTGPDGGPPAGPSQKMIEVARTAQTLACLFLAILPLSFFEKVAKYTYKYCYEDWVVEKVAKDRDGNEKKKKILVDCPAKTNGSNTPGRRHHCDKEKVKYKCENTQNF